MRATRDSSARTGIIKVLATDREYGGIGPFCLLRPQQAQLADMALTRVEGPFGPEFEDIPLADVTRKIEEASGKSDALRQAISSLKDAASGEQIAGGHRLTAIQRALVELLAYLENREGFLVRVGPRRSSTCGIEPVR
jgi:hypothetical protein